MKVSIIIPCWNAERFIGRAIESALGQTYPDIEVIIVDDGSTDASLDVIKSFGSRVRWESGPNRGGSAARNRGLELARGEFIQFLDADDALFSHKLALMVPIAKSGHERLIPICDWESVEDVGDTPPTLHLLRYDGEDSVQFTLRRPIQTSSPLHRTKMLQHVGGFTEELPCSQERDLHIRLAAHGAQLHHLPQVLYRITQRAGSVSSSYLKVLDQHAAIFLRAAEILDSRDALTPARRRAIAEAFARDGRHYVERGRMQKARDYFALAGQVDPQRGLGAFGQWHSRWLARLIGPVRTEQLIQRYTHRGVRVS